MIPLSDAEILVSLAVATECLTGFVFAEIVRLNFFTRWLSEKPQYRAAWMLGAATLGINLASMLLERSTGAKAPTPAPDMSLLSAVVLYPAICLGIWLVYLAGRRRSLWSGPTPPRK